MPLAPLENQSPGVRLEVAKPAGASDTAEGDLDWLGEYLIEDTTSQDPVQTEASGTGPLEDLFNEDLAQWLELGEGTSVPRPTPAETPSGETAHPSQDELKEVLEAVESLNTLPTIEMATTGTRTEYDGSELVREELRDHM